MAASVSSSWCFSPWLCVGDGGSLARLDHARHERRDGEAGGHLSEDGHGALSDRVDVAGGEDKGVGDSARPRRVDGERGEPRWVGGGEDAVGDDRPVGRDGVDDARLALGDALDGARGEGRAHLGLAGSDELAVDKDAVIGRHRDGAAAGVEGEHLGDDVVGLVLDGDHARRSVAPEDVVTDRQVGHELVLALGLWRREAAHRRGLLGEAGGVPPATVGQRRRRWWRRRRGGWRRRGRWRRRRRGRGWRRGGWR